MLGGGAVDGWRCEVTVLTPARVMLREYTNVTYILLLRVRMLLL